jgi:hypothetical protein
VLVLEGRWGWRCLSVPVEVVEVTETCPHAFRARLETGKTIPQMSETKWFTNNRIFPCKHDNCQSNWLSSVSTLTRLNCVRCFPKRTILYHGTWPTRTYPPSWCQTPRHSHTSNRLPLLPCLFLTLVGTRPQWISIISDVKDVLYYLFRKGEKINWVFFSPSIFFCGEKIRVSGTF